MSADEQGYNGWKNYETWAVNLHLSNDQDVYNAILEVTRESNEGEYPRVRVADAIKEWIEDWFEPTFEDSVSLAANLMHDLIGGALSSVDWIEIADHWIESANEQ